MPPAQSGSLTKSSSYLFPQTYDDLALVSSPEYANLVNPVTSGGAGFKPDKALSLLQQKYNPSFLQKYALPAAGVTALAASQGFFETPEDEEYLSPYTGQDIIDENPDYYQIPTGQATYVDKTLVPSRFTMSGIPEVYPSYTPISFANKGGGMFPRRTGAIGPGIGSGRKDYVPAMLTDGEFVMTRNAVKAAGNGNLNKGMKNMYSLMKNLETRTA